MFPKFDLFKPYRCYVAFNIVNNNIFQNTIYTYIYMNVNKQKPRKQYVGKKHRQPRREIRLLITYYFACFEP